MFITECYVQHGINFFPTTKTPLVLDFLFQKYNKHFLHVSIIHENNSEHQLISTRKDRDLGWVSYLVNKHNDGELYVKDSLGNNSIINTNSNSIKELKIWGTGYFINCDKNGKLNIIFVKFIS